MNVRALRTAAIIGATAVALSLGCESRHSGARDGGVGGTGGSSAVPKLPGPREKAAVAGRLARGLAEAGVGDPGWQEVSWDPPGCTTEVARVPRSAVPELEWRACEGVSGCDQLVVNWEATGVPFQGASIYKKAGTLRLSIHMWTNGEWRKAVYDGARNPIAAWRGPTEGDGACASPFTGTNASGVCLLSGKVSTTDGQVVVSTRQVLLSLADPTGAPAVGFDTNAVGSDGCTDDIFTGVAGGRFVLEFATGTEHAVRPPSGELIGFVPHADVVFLTLSGVAGSRATLDGWIWTRDETRRLVAPASDHMIYDFRGDGSSLAWIEVPYTPDYQTRQTGELWTSPFTMNEGDVVRRLVRRVPEVTVATASKALGDGHYALVRQPEDTSARMSAHVYRLSDGRHWELPAVGDLQAGSLLHVDRDETWYLGLTPGDVAVTIIRQRLSALGEGD